jgi:hypothetical protein
MKSFLKIKYSLKIWKKFQFFFLLKFELLHASLVSLKIKISKKVNNLFFFKWLNQISKVNGLGGALELGREQKVSSSCGGGGRDEASRRIGTEIR